MSEREPELHERNPTGRFSDRAADYVKYRPDYPPAAFEAMLAGLGEPAVLRAADVGAGTGISARALAGRIASVLAVEPNAAMRAAAEQHPRVRWVSGTAEATGLAGASVELVLCAQAFHWFRPAEALAEFRRVLRPAGRLALMWNIRNDADELTHGYGDVLRAAGDAGVPEVLDFDPAVITPGGAFAPARVVKVPHTQLLTRVGLAGRALSASYVPREGPGRDAIVARLEALHDRHRDAAGLVTLRYETWLYLADVA